MKKNNKRAIKFDQISIASDNFNQKEDHFNKNLTTHTYKNTVIICKTKSIIKSINKNK